MAEAEPPENVTQEPQSGTPAEAQARPRVFLDVSVGGDEEGRMVLELFSDVAPRTAENFRQLCTGEAGVGSTTGLPLSYKGCPFHRVIKGFMAQSGDFSNKNGTGGESIYGAKFDDEEGGLALKHDKRGLLSMANSGPNTNGSQFFVTFAPAPHLNGKHCVFGKLIKGWGVLKILEQQETDGQDRPIQEALICDCGQLAEGQPDGTALSGEEDGDIYPDWPQDLDDKPGQVTWWMDSVVKIKTAGNQHFKAGDFKVALRKYRKALRFLDQAWECKDLQELPPDKIEELSASKDVLLNNSALCKMKLGDLKGSVMDCNFVLSRNPKNVKALFRRGQAHLARNDLEMAVKDLSEAAELDNGSDRSIKTALAEAKQKVANRRQKERSAYAKMFS